MSYFGLALSAMLVAQAGPGLWVHECDRVDLRVESPADEALGQELAAVACAHAERLQRLFGRQSRGRIRIEIAADMQAWQRQTGRSWQIGAALVCERIILQPARSLRRMQDPDRAVAHELVHLMIRRTVGRACPRWLDEGLADRLSGAPGSGSGGALPDERGLAELERRLGLPDRRVSRAQRLADYRLCRALVDELARQVGVERLVAALPGLRQVKRPLDLELHGRSLRQRLFGG
ncbi:MAG: hypothetical protein JXR96_23295 [Deltaproteobacteria bacterium]|nr:hypothetical protein [Deltaproteobacteria bacterium]